MLASVLLALTQGLGMNLVSANLPQVQGALGATTNEAMWLVAAYMAPYASLSLLLIKVRTQFGLRNFAELAILAFLLVSVLHLFVDDLRSAIIVRFFSGVVAAPLSALAFLYMLEPLPQAKKLNLGLSLALTNLALAPAVARLISPTLLDIDLWHGLHVMEIAIAMMAFAAVYLLPLAPQPRAKVIQPLDVVSYLFIAIGFGLTAMVMTVGRFYWWFEAPWLGLMLFGAIIAVTCAAVIELNRANPLLDIRWLASREVLHFTAALLIFRIVLSEQTSGAFGFFQILGLQNGQMATLSWIILATTIAGGLACAAVMKPGREPAIHMVALSLLAAGAYMDSQATNLTRPAEMYLSQALIAFAGALFLPPALASGLMSALKKGPNYILSFVIVFLTTQSIGGSLGSAVVGTFVTWRSKFHYQALAEHIMPTDPVVAQRIAQLSVAYGRLLTDGTLMKTQGLILLNQQVTREANVLAYNDAFLAIALLAAFALSALVVHVAVVAIGNRLAATFQPSAA
ncbi:MFS transporter [Pseudaminobacter sp. 19-2017]|uniref:MFS transporter n=1 Tax=Pseudaminobacter soli (ex Zhang et al. 2022) TaxID=2831468 RepID=A0A942DXK1_9HYPH|nr:MFS transporter [Pseudaminobacter soli]MBS3647213.1 MFS transporter [Pseudaminobacter soli]